VDLEIKKYLNLAQKTSEEAVNLIEKRFPVSAGILTDQAKDIKTLADLESQEFILQALSDTGIPILAEESTVKQRFEDLHWIVDPLDGTMNFSRGFPMACVSIALWNGMQPVLGVINDIFSKSIFTGIVGEKAFNCEEPISISKTSEINQAIIATGFPSGRDYSTNSLQKFVEKVQCFKKVRMLGSAAHMLAQVAAGRFDVYEEEDIYIWDVAAGLAILQAAGGCYNIIPGSNEFQYNVRATNGIL
jgi:fructose-1,6-bisphosphatase/inositol monophosphatase family enzyme